MKLAGFLSLALAIVLALWATTDWYQNYQEQQANVRDMHNDIEHHIRSGDSEPVDRTMADMQRTDDLIQRDELIGVVAFCALIGAVVMFSQGRKGKDGA
jgi:hypothetical protein